jgi:solute carrier family 25 folate transporter 32
MSLDRSTPSSHGKSAFSPSISQQLPGSSRGFVGNNAVPLTRFEYFCLGRSDSTFNAMAGAIGGFASGVVTCPLDVIKTKLQAQGGFRAQQANTGNITTNIVYQGMLGTARTIWRDEGLKGMYRGLGPIILGYLPTWAVWFTVYGKSKDYFSNSEGS